MYWTVVVLKPWRNEIFLTLQAWNGAPTALVKRETNLFAAIKRPLYGLKHPPSSSTEIKERVKPYLYSIF